MPDLEYDTAKLAKTHGPITDHNTLKDRVFEYGLLDNEDDSGDGDLAYALFEGSVDLSNLVIILGHAHIDLDTAAFGDRDEYKAPKGAVAEHQYVLVLAHDPGKCLTGVASTDCTCAQDQPFYMVGAPAEQCDAVAVTKLLVENTVPWNHHSNFDGYPGMVWYAESRQVRGGDVKVGDCVDTIDHRGCRMVLAVFAGRLDGGGIRDVDPKQLAGLRRSDTDGPYRTIMIGGGELEVIRTDVSYPVVNPDSQVTGTPVDTSTESGGDDYPDESK